MVLAQVSFLTLIEYDMFATVKWSVSLKPTGILLCPFEQYPYKVTSEKFLENNIETGVY